MRHINKSDTTNCDKFKAIVTTYLAAGKYRYDDLTDPDRIGIRKILGDEQDWICAYCMRIIRPNEATTDHVIPKSISRPDYKRAYRTMGEGLYRNDFMWDKVYTPLAVGRYYPHPLAYGNLVCSCHDCNSTKDDYLTRPAFFKNPPTHISYNEKGFAEFNPTDTFPSNLKSWINNDKFIKTRCIWRAIRLAGISVGEVENAADENSRKELLDKLEVHIGKHPIIRSFAALSASFCSDAAWNYLLNFKWFWDYYQVP